MHFQKYLKNEIQIHSQLSHSNIVNFIEFIETNNNYYIILELCEKGTLHDVLFI